MCLFATCVREHCVCKGSPWSIEQRGASECRRCPATPVCLCHPVPPAVSPGQLCERAEDRCLQHNPCLHGGTCKGNACICPEGYTGPYCQHSECGDVGRYRGHMGTRGNMSPVPITLSPAGTALSELDRDWQEGSGGGGMVPRGAVHPFSPFLNPKPMLVRGCSVVPSHPISPQMPLGSSVPLSVTAPTWPCPATSSPAGEWRWGQGLGCFTLPMALHPLKHCTHATLCPPQFCTCCSIAHLPAALHPAGLGSVASVRLLQLLHHCTHCIISPIVLFCTRCMLAAIALLHPSHHCTHCIVASIALLNPLHHCTHCVAAPVALLHPLSLHPLHCCTHCTLELVAPAAVLYPLRCCILAPVASLHPLHSCTRGVVPSSGTAATAGPVSLQPA